MIFLVKVSTFRKLYGFVDFGHRVAGHLFCKDVGLWKSVLLSLLSSGFWNYALT